MALWNQLIKYTGGRIAELRPTNEIISTYILTNQVNSNYRVQLWFRPYQKKKKMLTKCLSIMIIYLNSPK